jgi:hypothetical protein
MQELLALSLDFALALSVPTFWNRGQGTPYLDPRWSGAYSSKHCECGAKLLYADTERIGTDLAGSNCVWSAIAQG